MNYFKTCKLVMGSMLLFAVSGAHAQTNTEIKDFFIHSITGQTPAQQTKKTEKVKLNDLDKARQRVWAAWKAANQELDEPKLPALVSLDSARTGQIILPDSLEPQAVMDYYWGTKSDSIPLNGYPVYLYLHGSGPRNSEWSTGLQLAHMFKDSPSAYFIPRIPNEGNYYRWWQRSKQWAWQWLIRQLMLNEHIDARRLYVFGISEGGYGSQRLASFYADYWAAAGPMAGGEPLKNAPAENCRHIGFSLLTGAKDNGFYRNSLTRLVQKDFDSLQTVYPNDFKHRIALIPERGHSIDYRPTTPWLQTFIRDPHPTTITWEDFEMDGWHRPGFYNLKVDRRPNDSLRTRYEMNIQNNIIELEISNVHYQTTVTDPYWGIELQFAKTYTPATGGELTLFLDEKLVDLNKKVTINVNGKQVFNGRVRCDLGSMMQSLALFYDRERIFPAAVTIKY